MQIKMPSLSCRPRIAGSSNNYAFGDEFSTGDLPRNQPFCQYSPRGSFYPGGLSERARSNWDTLHHQGATTASDILGQKNDGGCPTSSKKKKKKKKKKSKCQSESSNCGVDSIVEEVTAFSSPTRLSVSSMGKTSSDHENVVSVVGVTDDINTGVPKTCVIGSAGDIDLNHDVNDKPRKKRKKKKRKQSESSKCGVDPIMEEVTAFSSPRLSVSSMGKTSSDHENVVPVVGVTDDMNTGVPKTCVIGSAGDIGLNHEVNDKPRKKPKKKKRQCQSESSKCGVDPIMEEVTAFSSSRLSVSSTGKTSSDHENVVSVFGVTGDINTGVPKTCVIGSAGDTDLNHEVNDRPRKKPKKKRKKKPQSKSSEFGVESMTVEVADGSSQSLSNGNLVESTLTSACEKYLTSSANTTMDALGKNTMAEVNVGLSQEANKKPEEPKDEMAGVSIDLKHHISGKVEETKHIVNKCLNSMKEDVTGTSSQGLPIGLGGTSLEQESVVSVDMSTSIPRTDVLKAVLANDHPVESNLMAGVNFELNHDLSGKPEETMHIVKAKSKKRKRKNLPSSSKCGDNTMKEEATDASSQRLSIGSMGGDSLKHESVLSVDMSTSTPRTDVHRAGLTSDHPLESDLMTGVNVELNHDVNGKPEERMHTVQAKSKKRKPKNLPSSSTCGVNSMEKEVTDASSQRLAIGSMGGTSLDHENILSGSAVTDDISKSIPRTEFISAENTMKEEATDASSQRLSVGSMGEDSLKQESVLSVDMSTSTPRTDVHRASLTSDHPLESDLMTGVNVELNHDVNGKPKETMHTVQAKSKKRKRKNLPSSSKCGVNSTEKEVADDSSQRLAISSMGGASLDHENILSVSAVTDDISKSIPRTEVISAVTANDHSVDERGKRVVSMTVQNTMKSLPAVPEKGMLCKNADNSSLQVSQPSRNAFLKSRRKLLVLDLNGLLADITADYPRRLEPDFKLSGKGVFVRPFCDDFLQFCFEKFDVGIWSSRAKKNVSTMVDLLMKDTKKNLLFCWNNSHCTGTGFKTIENKDKPIVLKELKKLWEKRGDHLRWKKGFYDESNTVLLDDSPYKALRNPPHTAVFPFPYSFKDVKDKSLGPDGDLRLYLGRLAEAENVQEFIRANPFGQKSITSANISWNMYSKIAGEFAQEENGIASTSTSIDPYLHSRQRISLKAAL